MHNALNHGLINSPWFCYICSSWKRNSAYLLMITFTMIMPCTATDTKWSSFLCTANWFDELAAEKAKTGGRSLPRRIPAYGGAGARLFRSFAPSYEPIFEIQCQKRRWIKITNATASDFWQPYFLFFSLLFFSERGISQCFELLWRVIANTAHFRNSLHHIMFAIKFKISFNVLLHNFALVSGTDSWKNAHGKTLQYTLILDLWTVPPNLPRSKSDHFTNICRLFNVFSLVLCDRAKTDSK